MTVRSGPSRVWVAIARREPQPRNGNARVLAVTRTSKAAREAVRCEYPDVTSWSGDEQSGYSADCNSPTFWPPSILFRVESAEIQEQ
jgi:hypothetical protein